MDSFEKEVVEYVKPNHGTTTLGFIFQGGIIIAVDSRASQGSYICTCDLCDWNSTCSLYYFNEDGAGLCDLQLPSR